MARRPSYRILADLEPAEVERLLSGVPSRQLSANECVLHEGDRNASLFLIESGAVEVVKAGASGDQVLAHLGPGNFFGELSIFDPGPASATVRATKTTRVQILDGGWLAGYLSENPVEGRKLYQGILTELARRLRRLDLKLVERIVWVRAEEAQEGSG